MKYTLILLISVCVHAISIGQSVGKFSLPKGLQPENYMPKTIVFKVVESQRALCQTEAIGNNTLLLVFNQLGVTNLHKKFPSSPKPSTQKDRKGRPLTDLSLIYECDYTANISLEKAINLLLATKLLNYAEPHYIDQLTYTPNDTAIGQAGTWWYAVNMAFEAWDIQKGDTNIVVGITDTGTELTQIDLAANMKLNYADPIDGVDNDNDGYADNFNGWDVGENDNDPTANMVLHGLHVSGLSSAVPDNIAGMAGSGFNCKYLPIKITDATGAITKGYEGVVYAAEHGCRIINCSWGSPFPSITGQSVIDYVTINLNSLVVAGCGNADQQTDFYPASSRYVISTGSHSDQSEKSPFSNYSYNVDILGPGQAVLSTWFQNSFLISNGTSMASPVVAGAAGLVMAQYPWMDALQVGEQLRATADLLDTMPSNAAYSNRLGKGRLNMLKAVSTPDAKSVLLNVDTVFDENNNILLANDTVNLFVTLTNYLAPLGNASVSLSFDNSYATVLNGSATIGSMATYGTASPSLPFRFRIEPGVPINFELVLDFEITDGSYITHVFYPLRVHVDYLNITVNEVWTTVTSRSNFGYNGNGQNEGIGFLFNGENLLYEGGFYCGRDTLSVSDNLRGVTQNSDFILLERVSQTPSNESQAAFESWARYADNSNSLAMPVSVRQRSRAFTELGHTRYILFDYWIKNEGQTILNNFYAGVFTDWDIMNYNKNRADEVLTKNLGYAFATENMGLYAGVQLLSEGPFIHYAFDNIGGAGGGINLFDSFTEKEKYLALSTNRAQAGQLSEGNDIINSVGSGPYSIAAGDSIKLSFALLAGENLTALNLTADSAKAKYASESLITGLVGASTKCSTQCVVFPNPIGNEFSFNTCLGQTNRFLITLTGMEGKQYYKRYFEASQYEQIKIDTESLPQGIYLFTLNSPFESCSRKVVKN